MRGEEGLKCGGSTRGFGRGWELLFPSSSRSAFKKDRPALKVASSQEGPLSDRAASA